MKKLSLTAHKFLHSVTRVLCVQNFSSPPEKNETFFMLFLCPTLCHYLYSFIIVVICSKTEKTAVLPHLIFARMGGLITMMTRTWKMLEKAHDSYLSLTLSPSLSHPTEYFFPLVSLSHLFVH